MASISAFWHRCRGVPRPGLCRMCFQNCFSNGKARFMMNIFSLKRSSWWPVVASFPEMAAWDRRTSAACARWIQTSSGRDLALEFRLKSSPMQWWAFLVLLLQRKNNVMAKMPGYPAARGFCTNPGRREDREPGRSLAKVCGITSHLSYLLALLSNLRQTCPSESGSTDACLPGMVHFSAIMSARICMPSAQTSHGA